jgi:hypothetical protein
MKVHTLESAIEEGRIDKSHHDRLLAGLDWYTEKAGISPAHVFAPLKPTCDDLEIEWLKEFKSAFLHAYVRGFVFHGEFQPSVMDRMQLLAGWLLRNYVNGRVMLMREVMACLKGGEMPKATVLLVPDFYVGAREARLIPDWQVGGLHGMLLDRQAKRGITMLGVSDMVGMEKAYGHAVASYLAKHYQMSVGTLVQREKETA